VTPPRANVDTSDPPGNLVTARQDVTSVTWWKLLCVALLRHSRRQFRLPFTAAAHTQPAGLLSSRLSEKIAFVLRQTRCSKLTGRRACGSKTDVTSRWRFFIRTKRSFDDGIRPTTKVLKNRYQGRSQKFVLGCSLSKFLGRYKTLILIVELDQ